MTVLRFKGLVLQALFPSFTKLDRPLTFLYNGLSREVKAVVKLGEGDAYGVIIVGNQKPNEGSNLGVRVGRITANVIVWYIDYQSNDLSC